MAFHGCPLPNTRHLPILCAAETATDRAHLRTDLGTPQKTVGFNGLKKRNWKIWTGYPLVNIQKTMERSWKIHHVSWENSLKKLPFSIAILTSPEGKFFGGLLQHPVRPSVETVPDVEKWTENPMVFLGWKTWGPNPMNQHMLGEAMSPRPELSP